MPGIIPDIRTIGNIYVLCLGQCLVHVNTTLREEWLCSSPCEGRAAGRCFPEGTSMHGATLKSSRVPESVQGSGVADWQGSVKASHAQSDLGR